MGNYSYIDDLGDTIELINGVEHVVPTKEDLSNIRKVREEQNFISLESFKKKLSNSLKH